MKNKYPKFFVPLEEYPENEIGFCFPCCKVESKSSVIMFFKGDIIGTRIEPSLEFLNNSKIFKQIPESEFALLI